VTRRPPRLGPGRPDDELAERAALQAVDLPGGGWDTAPADPEDGGGPAGDDLDACLDAFPHDAVAASADSARYTRGDALAYSVAWVLADVEAAGAAARALADPGFARCFADRVAAAVAPEEGTAELLGHVVAAAEPLELPAGPGRAAAPDRPAPPATAHALRLTAATAGAVFDVHLHVVVVARGRVVTALFLADTPEPVPADDLAAVAGRVRLRLPDA
jgi:hypothetical protein